MDGLGRTPIPGQKLIRGKIVKTCHGRQYKRSLSCTRRGVTEQGRNKGEKEVRKGGKDRRENRILRKEKGIRKKNKE